MNRPIRQLRSLATAARLLPQHPDRILLRAVNQLRSQGAHPLMPFALYLSRREDTLTRYICARVREC